MIDDLAIRAALEGVLGDSFLDMPVGNETKVFDPQSRPHIRTRLIRVSERNMGPALTIATGMFEVLVHVPADDGTEPAEEIASRAKNCFRPLDQLLGDIVRVVELAMLEARPGTGGRGEGDASWTVVPVQIDWSVEDYG